MGKHYGLSNMFRFRFFWSHALLIAYIGILFAIIFGNSMNRFFVADDFSWIRWAKDSNMSTLLFNFIDAQGFFFRPIDKAVLYFEYNLFGLNPYPYYFLNIVFNYFVSITAYILFFILFKSKPLAFLGALIFSFLPSHTQNLFWIATISTTLSTLFILLGLSLYYFARTQKIMWLSYLALLSFFCAVFSYENAVIFILLMVLLDTFVLGVKKTKKKGQMYFSYIVGTGIIVLYLVLRYFSNAAGFSGDYDYNIVKILPNSAGNLIGYLLMLFSGEHLLHVYMYMRDSLKQYWIVLSVIGFFVVAFLGGFLIEHKEKIHISKSVKLFIFGFLFAVLSLLPYLPLGNITLRYVYLGSFGFIVVFLVLLRSVFSKFSHKKTIVAYGMVGVLYFLASYVYMQNALRTWEFSSKITRQTFMFFESMDAKQQTNAYIYNIPIKSGEAYIFPVGIVDMIYLSNNKITPYLTNDYSSSLMLYNKDISNNKDALILTFDKEYSIYQANEAKD